MDKKMAAVGLVIGLALILMIGVGGAQYYNEPYYDDDAAFCFGSAMCIIGVVWLIIAIAIAVWVYKDAEARGENGVLWLIIVILLGLIGLIIWLIARPKELKGEKKE